MKNSEHEQTATNVCSVCGKSFCNPAFGLGRQFERTIFSRDDSLDEVEVIDANQIIEYCSAACLKSNRDQVLAQENIRPTYPDLGSAVTCSRCGDPVDITKFHMTWIEEEVEYHGFEATPINVDVLAVACNRCVPPSRVTQIDD